MKSLLVTLLFFSYAAWGQTKSDSLKQALRLKDPSLYYKYNKPKGYTLVKSEKNKYELQSAYSSSYFILNADSSFVYYRIFEVGREMTLGKYTTQDAVITFNWDSLKTYKAAADPTIYSKYFDYGKPKPKKIIELKYELENNILKFK